MKVVLASVAIFLIGNIVRDVKAGDLCYSYYDHASKYQLDNIASSYPWDEVDQVMSQNPQLIKVLAQGDPIPSSPPAGGQYYNPVSVVCPSNRYLLKAFQVDGKQCWVLQPEVQQIRYTKCSMQYNRDCHYCSYQQGGVSKCDEDYEWKNVLAYCKPLQPDYLPVKPLQPDYLPVKPLQPVYPPVKPQPIPWKPDPVYPLNPQPLPPLKPDPQIYPCKTCNYYYDPYRQASSGLAGKRWKRSINQQYYGKVETICLYLPYQCSCKNFKC